MKIWILLMLLPMAAAVEAACFTSVANAPVTCDGSITQDTFNGCRQVTCSGVAGSITVLACDKPSSADPQHFEIYKQAQTGSQGICLGDACIQNEGFNRGEFSCVQNATNQSQNEVRFDVLVEGAADLAGAQFDVAYDQRSWTYVRAEQGTFFGNATYFGDVSSQSVGRVHDIVAIRLGPSGVNGNGRIASLYFTGSGPAPQLAAVLLANSNAVAATGTLRIVNAGAPVNGSDENETNACFANANALPATCTGGTIVQDDQGSCRTIRCVSGTAGLTVVACDKPGSNNPTHVELYRQAATGSGIQICLDDACIAGNGFARKDLTCEEPAPPTCTPSTEVCDQQDNDCDGQVDEGACTSGVSIAPWYPKGREYIFVCDLPGSSFDWNFGDGDRQFGGGKDVFHTYALAGTFTVQCTANGQTGSRTVQVS